MTTKLKQLNPFSKVELTIGFAFPKMLFVQVVRYTPKSSGKIRELQWLNITKHSVGVLEFWIGPNIKEWAGSHRQSRLNKTP